MQYIPFSTLQYSAHCHVLQHTRVDYNIYSPLKYIAHWTVQYSTVQYTLTFLPQLTTIIPS